MLFLLTYRSFTTPSQLFDLLQSRWNIPEPSSNLDEWVQKTQTPIRLRVFNVFKTWVQTYFRDFAADDTLYNRLIDFVKTTMMKSTLTTAAESLIKYAEQGKAGEGLTFTQTVIATPPKPITPKVDSPSFLDVNPTEFARQLTLLEHDAYRAINPWEFLKQRWAKKKDQAPNILYMIQFSNQVSNWLVGEVVKVVDLRQRTLVLKQVIEVAEKCRELNNYNAIMELLACLDSSPVYRLRQSWAGLSRSTMKTYESLKELMSPNNGFKNLRAALRTADPPAVPYLGVFLTDLTFIEEGNSDVLHGTKLINFDKRRKIATVIQEIRQRQHIPYNLCPVTSVQDLILNSKPLEEEVAYKLSVQNEQKLKSPAALKAEKEALKAAAVNKKRLGITGEDDEFAGMPLEGLDDYPFAVEDSPENIQLSKDGQIKGATLAKLIERITPKHSPDPGFLSAVLMTYPTFTTSSALLELLRSRFHVPLLANAPPEMKKEYNSKRVVPIQIRIFNAVKTWIEKFGYHVVHDGELKEELLQFVDYAVSQNRLLARTGESIRQKIQDIPEVETDPYPTLRTSNEESSEEVGDFLDFPPQQIANHFTALDEIICNRIQPSELVSKAWLNEAQAPSMVANEHLGLEIQQWVGTEIVNQPDPQKQAQVVSHVVDIAQALFDMNSFNAAYHMLAMLKSLSAPLKLVWTTIPRKQQQFEAMSHLPKRNARRCLQDWAVITPPAIPAFEVFKKKLCAIEDSGPDFLDNEGQLINFSKRQGVADLIRSMLDYRMASYSVEQDAAFQKYLNTASIMDLKSVKAKALENLKDPKFSLACASVGSSTKIRSGSSSSGPTTTEVSADSIKEALMDLFTEESFQQLLCDQVQEQMGISEAMHDLRVELQEQVVLLGCRCGTTSVARGRQVAHEIIARKLLASPSDVTDWIEVDHEGVVYGWPDEEVHLNLLHKGTTTFLVQVDVHMDEDDVASFERIASLYQNSNPTSSSADVRRVLITGTITESARAAAIKGNVEILLLASL
mmetsp:Transcript_34688/g.87212  ORF Transcript_34688/g.87212 Transcript_34688/m.87212 type:complete len:1018 (-) Transcript_34688:186-3239(-)